ncbi:MAG: DUF499 domain-containing protein [Actinomycetota bacterium]|nr:DUF499 domain-containing protein [Actinomycetota bacterium]
MRAFHAIAIPHNDILEGRLTMDVFAADLWEVYKGRAPEEYKDASEFFRKTYMTEGLKNILAVVEKRLGGKGGDPVIQIQTPFGGGKTHALIAMYHSAKQWGANRVIVAGTAMSADETIWGNIEQQLTGKIERFTGQIAPGREAIYALLKDHQPVMILMDEVLEYATKAAGVTVGDSTLADQTIAFMQELTEVAGTLEKTCVIVTLPSSIIEHYTEKAEKLFQQLQHVAGRVEKIYTPVQEHEITQVIRRRLFSDVDESLANKSIQEFMDYANRETLLPSGVEPSEYRIRFQASYPFLPEVVDVLYHRWGSFSSFQRTRGVLRLLSLVLYSLKDTNVPYITLADFDLSDQEIERELIKHIGNEFDSVIAADIIGSSAGSKTIDRELGKAYQGLKLGTRTATAIFMYSFSGGIEKGAGLGEIKRNGAVLPHPSSVVAEVIEKLKNKLFYLQTQTDKYFFTNQPNINRMLFVKMDNVRVAELTEVEHDLLKKNISGQKFQVYVWPKDSSGIPDDQNLKLIILGEENNLMKDILENKAMTPRVNRNTVIFLVPNEAERPGFQITIRKYLAYNKILDDEGLNLTEEQRKEIKTEIRKLEDRLYEALRRYYRQIFLPSKLDFREVDLGVPTYGEKQKIDDEVYDKLRLGGEILEIIAPLVVKEKYLKDRDFVLTKQLYAAGLNTPGEIRVASKDAWVKGIEEGVKQGLFGLGELEDGNPRCRFFKEAPSVSFAESEILISDEVCKRQKEALNIEVQNIHESGKAIESVSSIEPSSTAIEQPSSQQVAVKGHKEIELNFEVPTGKAFDVARVLNYLRTKFSKVKVVISAKDGQISEQDYEDKVKEAFKQMGIDIGD